MKALATILVLLAIYPYILGYSHSECSNLCYTLSNKYTAEVQQSLVEMNVCLNNCDEEILSASRFLSDCKDSCPQNDDMRSIYKCMQQCESLQSFNLESTKSTFNCTFFDQWNCTSTANKYTVAATNNITCGAVAPTNGTFTNVWANIFNKYVATNVTGWIWNNTANQTCANGTVSWSQGWVNSNATNASLVCYPLAYSNVNQTGLTWSGQCQFTFGQIHIFSLAFVLILVILSFVI